MVVELRVADEDRPDQRDQPAPSPCGKYGLSASNMALITWCTMVACAARTSSGAPTPRRTRLVVPPQPEVI